MGTVVTLPAVTVAELLAESFDFVWIDLEHGALDVADVQPLAIAARAAGSAALVRLHRSDYSRVGAILDAGVDGVVAPRMESADQARRLVDRLRHEPRGSRGFAARRASAYGRSGARLEVGEPLCLAQIESVRGVEAAAEIAAVEGVDALVVGCADLTLALTGELVSSLDHVREAIGQVQRAAEDAGIASGIAGPDDAEVLLALASPSSTVLVHSADVRIYARAADDAAARLRVPEREGSGVGA